MQEVAMAWGCYIGEVVRGLGWGMDDADPGAS